MENFTLLNEELNQLFGFGLDPFEFELLTDEDKSYCMTILAELIKDARKGVTHNFNVFDLLSGPPSINSVFNI